MRAGLVVLVAAGVVVALAAGADRTDRTGPRTIEAVAAEPDATDPVADEPSASERLRAEPLAAASADPPEADDVTIVGTSVGAVDQIRVDDGVQIVGWATAPAGGAPQVEIVVDNRSVGVVDATSRRPDVDVTHSPTAPAGGFDVTLDVAATDNVCVSALVEGVRRGLDCRHLDPRAFAAAAGGGPVLGTAGPTIGYSVEVEGHTDLHPEDVARTVDRVLGDQRSWIGDRTRRFQRVTRPEAAVRILVVSPRTVDAMCFPLATMGYLSCRQGNRVIMNMNRWLGAVPHWTDSLAEYRSYLVNHELGHFLGYGHVGCPGPGRLAPVMQQQTISLAGCRPNGWPYPSRSR